MRGALATAKWVKPNTSYQLGQGHKRLFVQFRGCIRPKARSFASRCQGGPLSHRAKPCEGELSCHCLALEPRSLP